MSRILLVDADVGFVMYMGLLLVRESYDVLPGRGAADALPLVRALGFDVELLMVDVVSPDGVTIIHELIRQAVPPGVIDIDPGGRLAPADPDLLKHVKATLHKPSGMQPLPTEEWQQTVKRVLRPSAFAAPE